MRLLIVGVAVSLAACAGPGQTVAVDTPESGRDVTPVTSVAAGGTETETETDQPTCSVERMDVFDPGVPVVGRSVKRRLIQTTISRQERYRLFDCKRKESDSVCRERAEKEARREFPGADSMTTTIEAKYDGDRPRRRRHKRPPVQQAVVHLTIDPGLQSVVEQLRMVMTLDMKPERSVMVIARAKHAGLTLSEFHPDGERTVAVVSCSRLRPH